MASQPAPEFSEDEDEFAPMESPPPAQPRLAGEDEAAGARGHRILWVAGLLTLIWFAAAAATVYLLLVEAPAREVALTEWAAVAAGIFAPVSAIWLIALVVARVDPGRGRRSLARIEAAEARFHGATADIEARIGNVDRLLVAASERTEALSARLAEESGTFEQSANRASEIARAVSISLSEDRERIDHAISRLAERGELTHDRLSSLNDVLPRLTQEAGRVGEIFAAHTEEASVRTREIAALVDDLETRAERAAAAATARGSETHALLTSIDETARSVETALASQRADLEEALIAAVGQSRTALADMQAILVDEVDQARTNTSAMLEGVRAGLGEQTEAINATLQNAHLLLDEQAQQVSGEIDQRLERLVALATELGQHLDLRRSEIESLFERADSRTDAFSQGISGAIGSADTGLSSLSERISEMEERTVRISAPASELERMVSELNRVLVEMSERLSGLHGDVQGPLSQELLQRRSEFETLASDARALFADFAAAEASAGTLAAPISQARQDLANSMAEMDTAREAVEATARRLEGDLGNAGAMLSELQREADDTAVGAASRLIEVLGRVREVASQASRSVRETFDSVVGEAVESLEKASGDAIGRAVATPVEENIGRIEAVGDRAAAAAQAAADRLARSLVSVAETSAAVEARVNEAGEFLETAQRRDLAEQSNLLIEALNSNAIDITKALSTEVTEAAWKQYLSGDQSVFARRGSRLVEASDAKDIARHYEEEPEFREAVRRYIHDFEAMLRRVMKDRQGNAMSVALLSSDVGRLYVALAQGTDRLRGKE